jgi:hypothetical protein
MTRAWLPIMLSLLITPSYCFGLGADHKNGDLPQHEGWTSGTYEAVNRPSRVHGYWINSSDTLFYKGMKSELNEMMLKLSEANEGKTVVVLHAASGIAQSPWSKNPIDTADWSVTISGSEAIASMQNQIKIDIWLGGSIGLDDLQVPPSVDLKSGGEIEAFIERYKESSRHGR